MRFERTRFGVMLAILTVSSSALLSGCTHVDPASLETFAVDFLRSAAAALWL